MIQLLFLIIILLIKKYNNTSNDYNISNHISIMIIHMH